MSEYPEDIRAAAHACYLECEQMDTDGIIDTISKFLTAERQSNDGEKIAGLWALLDDIDTLDDACKGNDSSFRKHCYDIQQKRFSIVSGEEFDRLQVPSKAKQAEETR